MRIHLVAAAGLALAAAAAAQSQSFTAPAGYDAVEGPGAQTVFVPWYDAQGGRYQWTDASARGQARPNISRLELRRDGLTSANPNWGARTTMLTVVMGNCNATQLTTTFAGNYQGATTTCLSRMAISLPSHVTPPATPPAPWTLAVPFTTGFSYAGTSDLLWELIAENSSPAGDYSTDAHAGGAGTSSALGRPCGAFQLLRQGPLALGPTQLRMLLWATGGPISQPGALFFGLVDPDTDYGGLLCANLRASPDLTLTLFTTSAGTIASAVTPLRLDLPMILPPVTVYTQFLVVDPTSVFPLPLRLSNAVSWSLTRPVPVSLLWYDGPNPSGQATGTRSGPVAITRFWY